MFYDEIADYESEQRDIANIEDDDWRARVDAIRRPYFPERDDPNGEG